MLTDHAEHPMKLPIDKKDDKEMMGIPKLFETTIRFAPVFLKGEPDHYTKGGGHNPSCGTGAGGEICNQELCDYIGGRGGIRERDSQLGKINHMGNDMDESEENYGPCNSHMER
jgi:hypothetical protein